MEINWWTIPDDKKKNFAPDMSGLTGLPVFTRDMFVWVPPSGEMVNPMGDNQQPYWQETPGYWDFTPEAKEKLRAYGGNWAGSPNSTEWQFGGGTPETGPTYASLKMKTGDTMSLNARYKLDGNTLTPIPESVRDEYWNTRDLSWGETIQGAFQHVFLPIAAVAAPYYAPMLWGGQAGTLYSTIGSQVFNALPTGVQEALTTAKTAWDGFTAPVREAWGSFEQFVASNPDAVTAINEAGASELGTDWVRTLDPGFESNFPTDVTTGGNGVAGNTFDPGFESNFPTDVAPTGTSTPSPYDLTDADFTVEQPLRNISQNTGNVFGDATNPYELTGADTTFDTNYAGTTPNQTWNNIAEGKPSGVDFSDKRVNSPTSTDDPSNRMHDDTSDMKVSDTSIETGTSIRDIGKAAWDLFNNPLGTTLLGGILKLGAGLYADKEAEKRYNELITRIDKSQNVTGLNMPQIGGLMNTMVQVPKFDAYKVGPKG